MTNQKNSLHAIFFDDIRGKRKKYVNKNNTKRAARDVTALFVWLIGSVHCFRALAGFWFLNSTRFQEKTRQGNRPAASMLFTVRSSKAR